MIQPKESGDHGQTQDNHSEYNQIGIAPAEDVVDITLRITAAAAANLVRAISNRRQSGNPRIQLELPTQDVVGMYIQPGPQNRTDENKISDADAVADREITRGKLTISPRKYEVRFKGRKLPKLTATEFSTLAFLASNPGLVYRREEIVRAIRGNAYHVTARSVDVHINGLRNKLAGATHYIQTVHGVGYRFQAPDQ